MSESKKLKISYSGSNTLLGCNRKYYYQKIKKVEYDPDFDDNTKALRLGKGFHEILEYCFHGEKPLTKLMIQKSFENNDIDLPTDQGMILGMIQRYIPLHKKGGLKCVGIEMKIGNDDYVGYIDAIMSDVHGNWWIVDLKTAARLSGSLLSRLAMDPQLNVYSHFAGQVADEYNLDLDKFSGVRYRVTTKANIKCNARESLQEFSRRVYDRTESYDIGIPVKDLQPAKVYDHLMRLLAQARGMEEKGESEIAQNFGFCESYFRPCPYWSRCYGHTFSKAADQYKIYDSSTIPSLAIDATEEDDLLSLFEDL